MFWRVGVIRRRPLRLSTRKEVKEEEREDKEDKEDKEEEETVWMRGGGMKRGRKSRRKF